MKTLRNAAAAAVATFAAMLTVFGAQTHTPVRKAAARAAETKPEPPTRDKVLNFIRERFGVVSTTQLSLSDFTPSPDPDFYQAVVTSNDGKQTKDQPLSISKDGRYLFIGPLAPLPNTEPGTIISPSRFSRLSCAAKPIAGVFGNKGK